MNFWRDKKVLITGATGFLGRHLQRAVREVTPKALVAVGSKTCDLTRADSTDALFRETKPDIVFHLAGLVGGILDNKERPADYFLKNLLMGTHALHYAWRNGAQKFICAGAGCGYPLNAPLPLQEKDLWTGFPQQESAPYSLAKRLLTVQSAAYFQQHGFVSITCIPGNIYGEFDNFNLRQAHVIPALVRKFIEAKSAKASHVPVWGSGTPTRDYVYAGDVAEGMVRAAEVYNSSEIVNLSSGTETSVKDICAHLSRITDFQGHIEWQTDRPEGQKRRWFDMSKAKKDLGFSARTSLEEGLKRTVMWYLENQNSPEVRR